MLRLLIAIAAVALAVPAAHAQCSKKALNGNWSAALGGASVFGSAAGGDFTFTSMGSTVLTLNFGSFSSKRCKGTGTGTFVGTPLAFSAASERVPGGSVKPNHLLVTITFGGTSYIFTLHRT